MKLSHISGKLIRERYLIEDILGTGGSGITYQAKDVTTNQLIAIKTLSLRQSQNWKFIELFEREAKVLQQLQHSAIPKYFDYFHLDTEKNRSFYLVQQLAPGKSLAQLVQKGWRTTETEVRNIATQVLKILIYLHGLTPPVIHRDLKPENIIRDDKGKVYLVDFGAVQDTYHSTFHRGSTMVGTYGYMAPEQFRGQALPQTDLYGLGTTLLFLLSHRSPADFPTERLKLDFRSQIHVSDAFADWLERMLEPDLEDRFSSAQEALDALQGKNTKANNLAPSFSLKKIVGVGMAVIITVIIGNYYKYPILGVLGFAPKTMFREVRFGNTEKVEQYLEQGFSVNAKDAYNHTPLHWAVSNNQVEMAAMLIDRGADLHAHYDEDQHTVLHVAVQHNTKDMAELLISRGADINVKDQFGYTPLHLAIDKRDVRFKKYFGMTHTEIEPSVDMVKFLLEEGADVNALNNRRETPLKLAKRVDASSEIQDLFKSYSGTQ